MKMSQATYQHILHTFMDNRDVLIERAKWLKDNGRYTDLAARIGYDGIRAFMPRTYIIDLYASEGLNDSHIATGLRKAVKEAGLLEEN